MSEDITIAIEQNGVIYENEKFVNFKLGEKDKEIEELKEELKEANDTIIWWKNRFKAVERDNRKLNKIKKEVRDYITYWHYRNDFRINSFTTDVKEALLEILDKENK